ncbi:uncharacterized protein LOC125504129 [Dendroctonus ponderosae]|uniref:uncharacterized protein LOC125504129 n=1 Tax=Dendroctonus ponderosae TaxID=77166 RepID=UPI002034E0C0|nr:uncharacterized protein LOC125504129 [Dendroctonus ponderosae]
MNEIIEDVKREGVGYRMAHKSLKILCYADDAATSDKTQSIIISKKTIRCKLMKFDYLGAQISSSTNLIEETRANTMKASRISGSLRDVIRNNKFMSTESKVRIYKTCVRPILAYASETRAETSRTKQVMRCAEMKTLRTIKVVTLRDQIRSSTIREELQVDDVVKWVGTRRRQ